MDRLSTVLAENRAQIRALDRDTLARVYSAYQDAMDRLDPLIELLQRQVTEQGGEMTPAQLFRLERYQELQRQLTVEMQRFGEITGQVTTNAQRQAVQLAGEQAGATAAASAARAVDQAIIATNWVRVPTYAVEDLVGSLNSGPLAELVASLGSDAAKVVTEQLVNGLATGTGPRVVADAIVKGTEIAQSRALTIARTETLRSLRSANLANFNANGGDVLKGWIWTCALGSNTCAACLAMDGTEHDLNETMDSHPNCRCSMRPSVKGIPTQSVKTGEQWFDEQDAKTQDGILGKSGGAAYRSGQVELGDFVKVDHSQDWGASIRDGGIGHAMRQAGERGVAA